MCAALTCLPVHEGVSPHPGAAHGEPRGRLGQVAAQPLGLRHLVVLEPNLLVEQVVVHALHTYIHTHIHTLVDSNYTCVGQGDLQAALQALVAVVQLVVAEGGVVCGAVGG